MGRGRGHSPRLVGSGLLVVRWILVYEIDVDSGKNTRTLIACNLLSAYSPIPTG